jgi:hypothetical protein
MKRKTGKPAAPVPPPKHGLGSIEDRWANEMSGAGTVDPSQVIRDMARQFPEWRAAYIKFGWDPLADDDPKAKRKPKAKP